MLKGHSAFSQSGPLNARALIWLMIYQRLHPKGTLSIAVQESRRGAIQAFVGLVKGKKLSPNTSAYSQARTRLPLEVAEAVSDLIFESVRAQPKMLPGIERTVFLLDGSSIGTSHSEDLAKAYPPTANQHCESHWPMMRVVVAHDVVSGLATRPSFGPMYGDQPVSEQALAKQIIPRLPENSVVLGDRNFGVFSMAYHAHHNKHASLFRLTDMRASKLNGGVLPPAGTDRVVHWKPSRDDLRKNREIQAEAVVQGRLLAFKIADKGGQFMKLYLFTTLALPAAKVLELYGYRWNIETDLRALKGEVRLKTLNVQSKAMAEKELVLAVAAYNLTRDAMNTAARKLSINPRELSFSRSQDIINAYLPAFDKAKTTKERQQLMDEMLEDFAHVKIPRRKKPRSYPRETWPRRNQFPKRKSTS